MGGKGAKRVFHSSEQHTHRAFANFTSLLLFPSVTCEAVELLFFYSVIGIRSFNGNSGCPGGRNYSKEINAAVKKREGKGKEEALITEREEE